MVKGRTHGGVSSQDEYEIYYARRRFLAGTLYEEEVNERSLQRTQHGQGPTSLLRISSGVEGGMFLISEGNSAAFKQFLILGASCALPSVFWREGTGWYVLNAVFISGKTGLADIRLIPTP